MGMAIMSLAVLWPVNSSNDLKGININTSEVQGVHIKSIPRKINIMAKLLYIWEREIYL